MKKVKSKAICVLWELWLDVDYQLHQEFTSQTSTKLAMLTFVWVDSIFIPYKYCMYSISLYIFHSIPTEWTGTIVRHFKMLLDMTTNKLNSLIIGRLIITFKHLQILMGTGSSLL